MIKITSLREKRFASKIVIPPKNILITIPFFVKKLNSKSIVQKIYKLPLSISNLKKVFIPSVNKNISGVTVNTNKIYNEIITSTTNEIFKLSKDDNLVKKVQNLTGYAILDLYPIYYSLQKLFDRIEQNKIQFFVTYFKIFHDYTEKVLRELSKINDDEIRVIPVIIFDVHDTFMDLGKEILEYWNEFYQIIRNKFDYEIPIPKLNTKFLSTHIYATYIDIEKSFITVFGTKESGAYVIDPYALRYTDRFLRNIIEAINHYGIQTVENEQTNEIIDKAIKYIENDLGIKVDENLKQFISHALEQYIHTTSTIPTKNIKLLIAKALRNTYNINANSENLKDILINHQINLIEEKLITPIVNTEHGRIYKLEEGLKLKSTIVDIHKREYNERLDHYINMLFKTLEDNPINKIKVQGYKKELKDDKLNRYWEYTFTIKNETTDHTFDVKVKVPALINDRYFKLNGKTYILVNQQFLKPITVTDKNKVRFLTYYSIVHLMLKNYKLHINDINSIIEYIISKYPKYIESYQESEAATRIVEYMEPIKYDYVKFKDPKITIYGYKPIGSNKFLIAEKYNENEELEYEVIYDKNEDKIYVITNAGEKHEINLKLNEYLFELMTDIIEHINPNDKLSTSTKQLPYVVIYIGGFTLPYILFMFSNFGVKRTLEILGIDYEISDKKDPKAYVSLKFNDAVINIYPKTLKQKYIINGLLIKDYPFEKYSFEDFENNQDTRNLFIKETVSVSAVKMFELMRRNLLDPITKEILKLEGYSDDLFEVFGRDLINALFNSPIYHPADLRISRVRNSEVILNILYKQLAQAKTEYELRIAGKTKHQERIYFDPDYVIKELLSGESLLQYTESINPIDELNTATRITPKGIGGIPSPAITARHRMIPFYKDPKTGKWVAAHFNNISANDTNEYGNIGVNQQLTWNALIGSRFGFFAVKTDISKTTFESLGIGESLAPMIQSIDHDRAIKMAQQMRQSLPINKPHIPLVASGAEFLVPQVTSNKFIIRAEDDGKVIDVKEGRYILVEYKDGTKRLYNIMPRISRTKRGLYLPLELIPEVKVGQKIKKGQALASVTQLQKGVYKYGRNVCVAVMQYNGGGYEDGWVVTEDTLEQFEYYEYKEIITIIPSESVVKEFVYKPGTEIKRGQPLIRFEYKSTLDEYLEKTELLSDDIGNTEEDNMAVVVKNNLGEIVIKSPYDGVIHNVKIYINGKVDSMIEKAWKELVREQEKLIKTAKQINNDPYTFADSVDTSMHKRGGHKWKSKEFQGALVMIFIKTKKTPKHGSKFVFRGGNKGTVTYIIPKDKKPVAKETGLKIDWIHNPLSIIGRKNANFLKEVAIGKIFFFLNKKAKEMANDSKIPTKDIKRMVIDVYETLCKDSKNKVCKETIKQIMNIDDNEFRKLCKQIDEYENPLFIYFAIPFTKITQTDINNAAKILGIPLEEKVYCPELNCETEQPVLVGFAYVVMLEHEPDSMMGFRSTGKYNILGQGQKGESRKGIKGAQSLETLTLVGLLDYFGDKSEIIKELFTVQSDDHTAKNDVLFQILNSGVAPEHYKRDETGSKKLARVYLYGLGLNPGF